MDNGSHPALLSTVLGFVSQTCYRTDRGQTVSSADEVRPFRQPKLFGFAKVQTWANHTHSDDNSLCSLL